MNEVEILGRVLVTARREITTSRQNCSPATVKSDEQKVALMRVYNPAMQVKYGSHPERCIMGTAPSLAKIRKEYGEQVALDWLRVELNDYQNFVAVKDENETPQEVLDEMAALVLSDFYFLKLSEVMLFFKWLKTGRYGEIYGRINPTSFFRALRSFQRDRGEIIARVENERRMARYEAESKRSVTYEEYQKNKEAKKLEQKK